MQRVQSRVSAQAPEPAVAGDAIELALALADSQKHVAELVGHLEAMHQREKELRCHLISTHEQLLQRDAELRQSVHELGLHRVERDSLKLQRDDVQLQRDSLKLQCADLQLQRDNLQSQRDELQLQRDNLQRRHLRIRNSLPGRLFRGLRSVLTFGKR